MRYCNIETKMDIYTEAIERRKQESFEIFGDTIDRTVYFSDGTDFSAYAGKPVRLRFRMRDAKIFSFKFE